MSVLLLIPTVVRSATAWRAAWETALTNVATAPATVLCIGDSITEGNGSTTKADRWTDRLNVYLQGRFNTGGVGGDGWVSSHHEVGSSPNPLWTAYTSQVGTVTPISTVGTPGYRALSMATSSSRTYTLTGTSVDIYWQRASGNGTFTWAVDGGSATAVSTSGATSVLTKTTVTLGGTVGASHTLTIAATTGPVIFEGLFVYNGDETHGPRMWEASHTGWDTNDFMNHADYANFAAFIGAIAPDLVMIQLGFNDYLHNTVTPSQYNTNLSTLLTTIDGLTKQPSIILIDSYDYGGTVGGQTATQNDFRTVLLNLVSADPDYRSYLNFGDSMPVTDFSGSGYYRTDGIHPNDSGYTEITRQLSLAISPWVAPSPITATATVVDDAYEIGEAPAGATVYATDTFTGTNGAAWDAQWTITATGGTATKNNNAGRLNNVITTDYTTAVTAYLSGMTAVADTDFLFSATWQSSGEQYFFAGVRSDGTLNSFYPDNAYFWEIQPDATTGYVAICRMVAGVKTSLSQSQVLDRSFTVPIAGTKYWFRWRIISNVIQVTQWVDGQTEPTPNWTFVDSTPVTTAGKAIFTSANGGGATARVIDIDGVQVTDGAIGTSVDTPLTGPPALANWRAAVEYRQFAPATWLAIGDSITEGFGATARTNRWIDQAVSAMRVDYPLTGVTGGAGFLPAWYNHSTFTTPYSSRAVGSGSLVDETATPSSYAGFGGRATAIGPGATVTYTITATAIDVWWIAGGGTLTVTIDGTLIGSISTAGTTGEGNHRNGFLMTAGSHTIILGATGSTARFAGIQVHNGDEGKGIRVIDAAHSGWRTADYTNTKYIDTWAAASPDLVTIMLGVNDRGGGTAGVVVSAATMKTNIQTFITNLRAALPTKPPSFVVCVPWSMEGDQAVWDPYAATLRQIVTEDPTITVVDFYRWMGYAIPTGYWITDGLHPSDTGHAYMGNQVADFLTTGTTPAAVGVRSSVALTHVNSSAWVAAATAATVAPTYPTGLADGDCVYAVLHIKPDTATVATPTNWGLLYSVSGGGGSVGLGTGPTKIWVYKRVISTGAAALAGTAETFTITNGNSPVGFMRAYRASGVNLRYEENFSSWSVGTGSTTVGGTTTEAITAGNLDEISVIVGAADDYTSGGITVSALAVSGVTVGTLTQVPTGTVSQGQGNDISATAYRAPITGGPTGSTAVVTATSSTAETAVGVVLRHRATEELVPAALKPFAVTQVAINRASTW